jgi:O-antigen ligase
MAKRPPNGTHRSTASGSSATELPGSPLIARILDGAMWGTIVIGVLLIPLYVSPTGADEYRYPKELLFRVEAIILTTLLLLELLFVPRRFQLTKVPRVLLIAVTATITWTAITAFTSTNRALSMQSVWWLAATSVVFLCTYAQIRRRGDGALWIILIPAVINALVALAQAMDVWHPFPTDAPPGRMSTVGLLGNPNDLAAFLVLPGIVAIALSFSGRAKSLSAIAGVTIVAGILASVTITAIAALVLGALILVLARKSRAALLLLLVLAVGAAALVVVDGPVHRRLESGRELLANRDFERLSSYRLGSSLVAIEMIRDHPFVGVGPGTFGWNYFEYRLLVADKYADWLGTANPLSRSAESFGEAHNDHLETAAESGIPGYALFLSWMVLIVVSNVRTPGKTPMNRALALAMVAAFAVTTLGLFPMQIAATTSSFVFVAAHLFARPDNPAI